MDDETKKIVQEQYAKLPKQLQDAIQSAHVHEQIIAIGTENKLHLDQMGVFENEMMLLMMGFTDPIEFAGELQTTLGIDVAAAQKLAVDANQKILLPIRDAMEKTTSGPSLAPETHSEAPNADLDSKSVVMPSAAKAAEAPLPTPASTAVGVVIPEILPASAPASTIIPVASPTLVQPTVTPSLKVEEMLSQPTVSIAPAPSIPQAESVQAVTDTADTKLVPPAPPIAHKVDPYREPTD